MEERTNWLGYEIPYCSECNVLMDDYSQPQRPFFVCPECKGDESGIEVEWCECGEPLIDGDCECGNGENEIEYGACGDEQCGGDCDNCSDENPGGN